MVLMLFCSLHCNLLPYQEISFASRLKSSPHQITPEAIYPLITFLFNRLTLLLLSLTLIHVYVGQQNVSENPSSPLKPWLNHLLPLVVIQKMHLSILRGVICH